MRELIGLTCLIIGAAGAVALAVVITSRFDVARIALGFLAPVSFLLGGGH
jgi:Na+-translocating ferredoxin:NAD+ oxidoreductase RnfE subunit